MQTLVPSQPIDAPQPTPARRFSSVAWLTLVLALGLILSSVMQKAYRLTLPTDGWSFTTGDVGSSDEDRPNYQANLLGQPSPLQQGDRLLAVEGRPFEAILAQAYSGQVQPLPNWRSGQTVEYTVERQGQPLLLHVPLYQWTLSQFLRQLVASVDLWTSTLLALVGCFVFFKRPTDWAARALLLFSICLFVNGISSAVIEWSLPELLTPGIFYLAIFYSNWIIALVMFPSLLLLTLTFPQPKRFVRQHPRLVLALLYGLAPFLIILFGPVATVGWLSVLAMALLSLIAMVHSFFTVRDPIGRAQMRWAAGGLVIMVLGFIPINLEGLGWWPVFPQWLETIWLPMLFAVVAGGFGMAILRYQLFDIDIIINRALVYSAFTIILTIIWVASTTLIQQIAVELAGSNAAVLSAVFSTVIVSSLFQPLRSAIENWVNERFYPENLDLMRDFTELKAVTYELCELADLIPRRISLVMRSNYAALFLNSGNDMFEAIAQWQIDEDDLGALLLPKAMHDRWGRARTVQQGEGERFRLMVPLYISHLRDAEVIGILALGPRHEGQGYSWDDRRGLTNFGGQIGVTLFAAQRARRKHESRD